MQRSASLPLHGCFKQILSPNEDVCLFVCLFLSFLRQNLILLGFPPRTLSKSIVKGARKAGKITMGRGGQTTLKKSERGSRMTWNDDDDMSSEFGNAVHTAQVEGQVWALRFFVITRPIFGICVDACVYGKCCSAASGVGYRNNLPIFLLALCNKNMLCHTFWNMLKTLAVFNCSLSLNLDSC